MSDFKLLITDWYRQNKRDLPWRETKDPFRIWLSEVILQQTRVQQGLPYYLKFTEHFSDVNALATADEQLVLNLWQGLGYYSRGRNLHQTAKIISNELKGEFPLNSEGLQKLKGIGPYTAAAIASFCYNEPVPVIDGNVSRVLSRVFDIEEPINSTQGEKTIRSLATSLIDFNDPATYNQAIMEFGALQCTPSKPDCTHCPLEGLCLAKQNKTIDQRPVKHKKTKIKHRYFHYAVLSNDQKIVITKREEKDIWQHLYQFPLVETSTHEFPKEILPGMLIKDAEKSTSASKHILSHQHIHAYFHHFHLDESNLNLPDNCILIDQIALSDYPLPRLIDKYLHSI
jgi:A/G-specific adenine glycosylase